MLDQPGTGEALRLQGLTARIDTEVWAGAAVDCLETRDDVDPTASGSSAGRSAATTRRAPPRSRSASPSCVAWGANHNWGAVQRRRKEREGERPVPHYWEHVLWVWGKDGDEHHLDEFLDFADDVHLDGVVEQITVPFLIAHGANDRQIPVRYAHRSYEQAVNSPKRELRVFTPEEGATEHIGLDHLPHVSTFVADWVADTFAELARRGPAHDPSGARRPGVRSDGGHCLTVTAARVRRPLAALGSRVRASRPGRRDDLHRQLRRPGRPRLEDPMDGPAARGQLIRPEAHPDDGHG